MHYLQQEKEGLSLMRALLRPSKQLSNSTTESEILLHQAFIYIGDKYFEATTDELYCFNCHIFFSMAGNAEICHNCGLSLKVKGSHAKPDFVLRSRYLAVEGSDNWQHGIVRVDGGIHKHSKRHANPDYDQVMKFREFGIRVFIILNEELSKKHPEENLVVADRIKLYMQAPDEVYERYFRSKAMQENIVKFR